MGKFIRREFLGNQWTVILLCFTGIGIPMAILHILEGTVTIEEEMEDPTAFLEEHKRRYSG